MNEQWLILYCYRDFPDRPICVINMRDREVSELCRSLSHPYDFGVGAWAQDKPDCYRAVRIPTVEDDHYAEVKRLTSKAWGDGMLSRGRDLPL